MNLRRKVQVQNFQPALFCCAIIEGLRPPKFDALRVLDQLLYICGVEDAVIFCVFCFRFQALAFSCPPCLCQSTQFNLYFLLSLTTPETLIA